MDASYLEQHVGDALSKGLAECALHQPADPVQFLGSFLLSFHQKKTTARKLDIALEQLSLTEASSASTKGEEEEKVESVSSEGSSFDEELVKLREAVADASWDAILTAFVRFSEQALGVSSCSIARKEGPGTSSAEEGGEASGRIVFLESTQPFMVGRELKESLEGPSPVSFDLWKPTVSTKQVEGGEGEEEQEVVEYPSHLHIARAMRHERVTFFSTPKLGSLLVAPASFGSILHSDGILKVEAESTQEGEGQEGVEEGEEGEGKEGSEGESKQEGPLFEKNRKAADYMFYVDSLGQGTTFSAASIAKLKQIASVFTQVLEEYEQKLFEEERERLLSWDEDSWSSQMASLKEKVDAMEEEVASLNKKEEGGEDKEEEGEDPAASHENEIEALKSAFAFYSQKLQEQAETILLFQKKVLPPSNKELSIFLVACVVAKVTEKGALRTFVDGSGQVLWQAVRKHLSTMAASDLASLDPEEKRQVLPTESASSLFQTLQEVGSLEEVSPVAALFFLWARSFVLLRRALMSASAEEGHTTMEEVVSSF